MRSKFKWFDSLLSTTKYEKNKQMVFSQTRESKNSDENNVIKEKKVRRIRSSLFKMCHLQQYQRTKGETQETDKEAQKILEFRLAAKLLVGPVSDDEETRKDDER